MNVVVLDITGRNAVQYNPSLCASLSQIEGVNVTLLSTSLKGIPHLFKYKKLVKLVPNSITSSENLTKRVLRLLEIIINYVYLTGYIFIKKPDVLHIQWLPLLEFASGESVILQILKQISPNTKLFYTVHNVFPHNMSEKAMQKYHLRFLHLDNSIDGYIVHLYSSKQELISDFNISEKKIHVAYHGIYVAENYTPKHEGSNYGVKKIIMFGYQNEYKGTDLLLEALKLLPDAYLAKIKVLIIGKTDACLYEKYESECKKLNVTWINRYVSDEELYESIGNSDLILLPYRKISQSGVLLLALSYRKPILTSNLPSFKETLEGYPEDYFFIANDPQSLENTLKKYLDGEIDEKRIKELIDRLNDKYSWSETGKNTYLAYKSSIGLQNLNG